MLQFRCNYHVKASTSLESVLSPMPAWPTIETTCLLFFVNTWHMFLLLKTLFFDTCLLHLFFVALIAQVPFLKVATRTCYMCFDPFTYGLDFSLFPKKKIFSHDYTFKRGTLVTLVQKISHHQYTTISGFGSKDFSKWTCRLSTFK